MQRANNLSVDCGGPYLDLGVAAVKSTYVLVDLAAPSQVKSFQFQVAAEIFHSSRRRILG